MTTSRIIYGTAWKQERTTQLAISAVLAGFRAIDTACQPKHYREELVGEALHILQHEHGIQREDLFLQTKFTPIGGQDATKPLPYNPTDSITKQIQSSFQKSLTNLRTTYIDSYLLHSPLPTLKHTLEAWRVMINLQDEGKVGRIGISNAYEVSVLVALGQERKVQVVQNRWYEGNQWDREVYKYCMENEIQYQSFWTLTGSPSLLKHRDLLAISNVTKCSAAQAVFKLAQMQGIVPLTGTSSNIHMQDDVATKNIEFGAETELHVKRIQAIIWS